MEEARTLYDYWMICYRRRVSVALLVVASVVAAVAISALMRPIYEARAIFYVPASATTKRANTSDTELPLPTSNQDDAKANIGILRGRDAMRAISAQFPAKSLEALKRDVDFTAGRDGLIYVYVRDPDPQLAASVANAYVRYFNQFMLQRLNERIAPKVNALTSRIRVVEQDIAGLRLAKMHAEQKAGTPLLDAQAVTLVRDREDIARERESLSGDPYRRQGVVSPGYASAARGRDEAGYLAPPASRVVDDLEKEVASLGVQLAGAQQKYLPTYPEVLSLKERYSKAKSALDQKLAELARADRSRAQNLERMVDARNRRLASMPELRRQQEENELGIRTLSDELAFLRQNLEEVTYSAIRSESQGIVVETAAAPEAPVFPIAWLNAVIALVLGALTGVLYAFLLDYIEGMRRAVRAGESGRERVALRA